MKIREVMTTDVRTAQLSTTIEDLAIIMRDEDIGSIPIIDEGELCGIVTDRDIVLRCIAERRNITQTTVEDIVRGDLTTVSPNHDTDEAARLMAEVQVRRLPVVDGRKLVGVVSIGDLAVKSDADEGEIGRTLEEVSEGVKASGRDAERAKRSNISDGRGSAQLRQNSNARQQPGGPRRQQPGSATQMTERGARQVRGRKPAAVTGGGRQETIESESGRFGKSTRGRIEAKEGGARRAQKPSDRVQKIAKRSATKETKKPTRSAKRVVKIDAGKTSRSQRRKAS